MAKRAVWEFAQGGTPWDAGEIAVTVHQDGMVLVEVTEEHAVDSYNHEFTCGVTLPPDKVRELAEFLIKAVGGD